MAANTEVTSSVKTAPVMRRLHYLQTKRTLAVAVGITAVVTVAFRLLYNNPRKAAYAEFYKNYDADKSFERMRSKGLFQSC